MACDKHLLKLLLVVFDALLIIAGVAVAAVAIWSIADKIFISSIIGTDLFSVASYFMIISGVLLLAAAVLGLVAVGKESRCLLVAYFITVLVIFLFLLVTGILAVAFEGELEDSMIRSMRNTLTNEYGNNVNDNNMAATKAWDRTQTELRCCAVTGKDWNLYQQTKWFMDQPEFLSKKKYVPSSCCKYDDRRGELFNQDRCQKWSLGPPVNPTTDLTNDALYYKGCYTVAKEFVTDQAGILVAIGFAFAVCVIAGLVLTVFLYRAIMASEKEEKDRKPPGPYETDVML